MYGPGDTGEQPQRRAVIARRQGGPWPSAGNRAAALRPAPTVSPSVGRQDSGASRASTCGLSFGR